MHRLAFAALLLAVPAFAAEPAPAPRPVVDLTGYRTVKTADPGGPQDVQDDRVRPRPPSPGWSGWSSARTSRAAPSSRKSPTAPRPSRPGSKVGDLVTRVNGTAVATPQAARDQLRGLVAGEPVRVAVSRGGKPAELAVTPKPASKPMPAATAGSGAGRITLGVQNESLDSGGVKITSVTDGSLAEKAGVKVGDVLLRVDDAALSAEATLRDVLGQKRPGDVDHPAREARPRGTEAPRHPPGGARAGRRPRRVRRRVGRPPAPGLDASRPTSSPSSASSTRT